MKTITDLVKELEQAKIELESAVERERIASRATTECRNKMNQIQKAIDAWYIEEKNKAPWDTDWSSDRNKVAVRG